MCVCVCVRPFLEEGRLVGSVSACVCVFVYSQPKTDNENQTHLKVRRGSGRGFTLVFPRAAARKFAKRKQESEATSRQHGNVDFFFLVLHINAVNSQVSHRKFGQLIH